MMMQITAVLLLTFLIISDCHGDSASDSSDQDGPILKRYRPIDELSGSHIYAKRHNMESSEQSDSGAVKKRYRYREIDELSGLGIHKKSTDDASADSAQKKSLDESSDDISKRSSALRRHLALPRHLRR